MVAWHHFDACGAQVNDQVRRQVGSLGPKLQGVQPCGRGLAWRGRSIAGFPVP